MADGSKLSRDKSCLSLMLFVSAAPVTDTLTVGMKHNDKVFKITNTTTKKNNNDFCIVKSNNFQRV